MSAQAGVARHIETSLPDAQIRWRYRLVANGMAVVVPRSQLARLTALSGVETAYPSVRYRTQLDRSPQQIGAPTPGRRASRPAGQGIKIAIIDEGIDQTHLLSAVGYTMPRAFRRQTAYTSAKVIVARAFPPARPVWKHASKPFDPEFLSHGTHVAGDRRREREHARKATGSRASRRVPISATTRRDDPDRRGRRPGRQLARAVAAIEAAGRGRDDVINMSLGEPEIEPSRTSS